MADPQAAKLVPPLRSDTLRDLFAQAPSFIVVLRGPDHVIEFANTAYQKLVAQRVSVGMRVQDTLPEVVEQGYIKLLDSVYQSGEAFVGREAPVMLQDAPDAAPRQIYVDFVYQPLRDEDGRVTGIFVQGHEVTEQKLAREQRLQYQARLEELVQARTKDLEASESKLRHSQKLEAVGKLTGGVAHDFNNLLQVIGGNLQLLQRDVAGNRRATDRVEIALGAVQRGAKLASQLLAFARRQPLEPRIFNPSRLVRGMDDLLRRTLGEGVQVETVVAAGQWNTLADPHQMENAILNLAINARDAMDSSGKLTIETGNAVLDDAYASRNADVQPGQYAMVAITDTGCGITAEVKEHLFEPFFTTKPEGQGTGLGLAMVYGFVKQSGGHIAVYSEEGDGTTFRIYLPRATRDEVEEVDQNTLPVVGGTETVLVVEDDHDVRETAVAMLKDLGYTVLDTPEAESALAVLRSGVKVDLLFTDVVMPGKIRSPELAKQAKQILPGIEVLFTSGYTDNAIVHGGRLDPGVNLLSKPYRREDLARKVRHLLRDRGQRAADKAGVGPEMGPRRVLVVEDDADIRSSTAELIRQVGHHVEAVVSSEAAFDKLTSGSFDVLLTDVQLGGTSGLELARLATERWPALRIVLMSGYSLDGMAGKAPPGCSFLQKPYDLDSLTRALDAAKA